MLFTLSFNYDLNTLVIFGVGVYSFWSGAGVYTLGSTLDFLKLYSMMVKLGCFSLESSLAGVFIGLVHAFLRYLLVIFD